MSRYDLTEFEWRAIEPLLPNKPRGVARVDDRRVLNGIFWVLRSGSPWRDLPAEFGPWQTVWKRHRRFAADGTWDRVHAALLADADAAGLIDWDVSVDSTINRAHQHATNTKRDTLPACRPRGHRVRRHALVVLTVETSGVGGPRGGVVEVEAAGAVEGLFGGAGG
mgnify:CR=1 FL=1